jgi:adenine-specific DNA methylase
MDNFGLLFNDRQALALSTLVRSVRQAIEATRSNSTAEYANAVGASWLWVSMVCGQVHHIDSLACTRKSGMGFNFGSPEGSRIAGLNWKTIG